MNGCGPARVSRAGLSSARTAFVRRARAVGGSWTLGGVCQIVDGHRVVLERSSSPSHVWTRWSDFFAWRCSWNLRCTDLQGRSAHGDACKGSRRPCACIRSGTAQEHAAAEPGPAGRVIQWETKTPAPRGTRLRAGQIPRAPRGRGERIRNFCRWASPSTLENKDAHCKDEGLAVQVHSLAFQTAVPNCIFLLP